MLKLKLKKTFTDWLITPYRVVIRNEEDLAEKSTFRFSYAKLITVLFFVLVLFFGIGLVLSHTILRLWLNPAYIEQDNSNKLMHLVAALEQLEEKNAQQDELIKIFQHNFKSEENGIQDGEEVFFEPVDEFVGREETKIGGEIEGSVAGGKNTQCAHTLSHLSREKPAYQLTNYLPDFFLFTPIEGVITTPFNPHIEHYGLDIVGKENEPIKCIADGKVILATWTVETGWVMAIQHSTNLLSVYKHNANLFKKIGDSVKGGEVIAIMGNSGEFTTGPHLHFEVWYEGNAIDPQDIIAF